MELPCAERGKDDPSNKVRDWHRARAKLKFQKCAAAIDRLETKNIPACIKAIAKEMRVADAGLRSWLRKHPSHKALLRVIPTGEAGFLRRKKEYRVVVRRLKAVGVSINQARLAKGAGLNASMVSKDTARTFSRCRTPHLKRQTAPLRGGFSFIPGRHVDHATGGCLTNLKNRVLLVMESNGRRLHERDRCCQYSRLPQESRH